MAASPDSPIRRKRRRKKRRGANRHQIPPEVRDLMQRLKHGPDGEKAAAAKALGNLGTQALPALEALCEGLESTFPAVRSWSAWAIMKIGPDARTATPALYRALQDEEDSVRSWSALALVIIRDEALISQLVTLTGNSNADLRCLAAQTLARLGPESQVALPSLRSMLSDDHENVRTAAEEAIREIEAVSSSNSIPNQENVQA